MIKVYKIYNKWQKIKRYLFNTVSWWGKDKNKWHCYAIVKNGLFTKYYLDGERVKKFPSIFIKKRQPKVKENTK